MLLNSLMLGFAATNARLIGLAANCAAAVVLAAVFGLLISVSSQRSAVRIWIVAWVAQILVMAGPAADSLRMLTNHGPAGQWSSIFDSLYWPARLVFVTAVALGALDAAGVSLPGVVRRSILYGAAATGVLFELAAMGTARTWVVLLVGILVYFGGAVLVLSRATGAHARGRLAFGLALVLYGMVATAHTVSNATSGGQSWLVQASLAVEHSVAYANTFALMILASTVIVVVVQDAFIVAEEAHERRISEVAASRTRLIGIIEAAREAIVTVDDACRIELMNGAAAELFKVDPAGVLGHDVAILVPEVKALLRGDPAAAGPSAPGIQIHEGWGRRAGGRDFPAEFTVGRLHDAGPTGSVVVVRDLTAQRAAEAEREALERDMAESAKMTAIGRVVSGVAHELNNPLAVVLGQSEQLTQTTSNADLRSGLLMIQEQAQRARHIIRDLLAFVRPREEPRERIDIREVIDDMLHIHQAEARARGVTIIAELPKGLPVVYIDRVEIEQVIINLLDNAVDAAGASGIVRISAASSGGTVEVAVEDTGTGIPDEMVSRVFEPFFTTKRMGQGTGLGLSVSLGIAQQHGGTLRFENRPATGIGARVVLALPADVQAREEAPRRPASRPFPAPPTSDGTVAEAMLIDDEPAVRTTLGRMFERAGWRVREAESGELALRWLNGVDPAHAPAVILCDLKMPGISGQEVYERLAASRPDLAHRLVFVTGDIVESVSSGFIAASGRDVVEKPFTIAEIAGAVERVVNLTG